jgi:hypothetical protein
MTMKKQNRLPQTPLAAISFICFFVCLLISGCNKKTPLKLLLNGGGTFEIIGASPGKAQKIVFASNKTYSSDYFFTGLKETGQWWLEEGSPEGDLAIMQSDAMLAAGAPYAVFALVETKNGSNALRWDYLGERTVANKDKQFSYTPSPNGTDFDLFPENHAIAASKEYLTGGTSKTWSCALTGNTSGLNPVQSKITFKADGSIVANDMAGTGEFDGTFTMSKGNWYMLYKAKGTSNIDVIYKATIDENGKSTLYTQSGYFTAGIVHYDFNAPMASTGAPFTLVLQP